MQNSRKTEKGLLGLVCLALLCGLLVAGLLPFERPKNGVTRLGGGKGLLYSGYGMAWSSGPILQGLPAGSPCSLEVRLRPASEESHTILAFYTPQRPLQFSLRQSNTDLVLRAPRGSGRAYAEADDVFRKGRVVHIAATFAELETKIYVNGVLDAQEPHAPFSCDDLEGRMVLGNSATQHDSWQGELLRLAIYDRELSPEQVLRHYQTWADTSPLETGAGEQAAAVYLMDEGAGSVLQNQIRPEAALNIPARYLVPEHLFLEPPWREFRAEWSYWQDVFINIGGFIPFGFAVRLYWSLGTAPRWASASALLGGAVVSLTIETLQFFLPTRDSSMTDVVTNTLGTAAGVALAARKGPEVLEFANSLLLGR